MKKTLIFALLALMLLSGCSKDKTTDDAPSIRYTGGQFYDTTPPIMEGMVKTFDENTITLIIKDQEYPVSLSERAKEEVVIFRDKYAKFLKKGVFLQIKYEMVGNEYVANHISFLEGNLQVE